VTAGFTAIRDTERWFLRRGLPHFIDSYSASRDVLTRAAPLLTVIFLAEVVTNAPKRSFPLWLDIVAVIAGCGMVLAIWAATNRARGRPAFVRPVDVGAVEIAVFVLVPPAIPLLFGGQLGSAATTALANAVLLSGIYLVTSYGLVPMTRWAAGETVRELNAVMGLFVRALPLLVLFVTFIFLQNEAWQITADLHGPFYWIVLAVFPLVGGLFAAIRLPKEIGELSDFESRDVVVGRVRDTPIESAAAGVPPVEASAPALSSRQWVNVGLVVLFSQFLQVALVSVMVFAFLLLFGVLVVTGPVVENFVGQAPHVLAHLDLWGRHMVVTEELLRVTGFLTVFSGFYFAVSVLTDDTYRKEFLEEIVGEMRRSLAVRAVYLGAITSAADPPT
jgi:hypothetical protein